MSYQVLARKWRPKNFAEVIGQGHVLKALINALDGDRLHHAYLFTGTRGVGKTTLARVFAKALNCEQGVSSAPCGTCSACEEIDGGRFVDLIEVDAASRTKVDETRELLDNVQYAPTRARYKVYLIDEVHMFSNHSFNALLKTLEEPPPHVKFLLATTDPKKLPVTILSRCLQFNLTRLGPAQIAEHLATVLGAEGIEFEPQALDLIAEAAAGSVRDALSLLDQAIAHGAGRIGAGEVALMLGTVDRDRVLKLLDALAAGDAHALIERARGLADFVPDYAQVLGEMLSLLRRVAVVHALENEGAELESDARVVELATRIAPDECQLFYQIALHGRRDLPLAPEPESGFEMCLLRMHAFRPATPPAATAGSDAGSSRGTGVVPAAAAGSAGHAAPVAGAASSTVAGTTPEPPRVASRATVDAAPAEAAAPAAAPDVADETPPPAPQALPETFDWGQVVEELGVVGLARELARNSAVAARDGTRIELVVSPQFEKLAQRRHVETLQAALAGRYGQDFHLSVRTAEDSGLMTPSEQRSAAAEQRQREAEAEIESDPNVRALRDNFGATIEDVSAR